MISPLLANVYLHYVLDVWFEQEVQPRLAGRAFLIRYADDFVIVFSNESDARRVMEVLPKRFGKYGLTLHPEKTRLVAFRPPIERNGTSGEPGTFDLLGFTHYWARSRRGSWVVKRQTASKRLSRGLQAITDWCRRHRHLPIPEQHQKLSAETARSLCLLRNHGQQFTAVRVSHAGPPDLAVLVVASQSRAVDDLGLLQPPAGNDIRLPAAVAVHSVCRKT